MHGTSMRTGGAHMPPGTCTGMCTTMVLYTTSRTCSSPTNGLPADRWGARSAAVGVGAVDLSAARAASSRRWVVRRVTGELLVRGMRGRTFDVVRCRATLRREHDPIYGIVLLPEALSPAHGAPTDGPLLCSICVHLDACVFGPLRTGVWPARAPPIGPPW